MEKAKAFAERLIEVCDARLFEESLPRLKRCLSELSDEEIWSRPNEQSNSVGNLVLHLSGNVRQWIVSGLGGAADTRTRSAEFSERGPIPRAEIERRLDETMSEAREVIRRLDVDTLIEKRPVQDRVESGIGVLVHVVEHFSYHVGQISYIVKAKKAIDLGYYAGQDLDVTN